MTQQQSKLCELMLEFHKLCEKSGAVYYLTGHQLLCAAQGGTLSGYELDVAMFWKDWQKIAKQTAGDRETESLSDGGNLPTCYFRYVDKNSLLLDLLRYGMLAKPGIGINIHIIRNGCKKSRRLNLLERGMEDTFAGKLSLAGCTVRFLRTVLGRRRFAGIVMGLLGSACAEMPDQPTELREPGQAAVRFEPNYWEHGTVLDLSGMSLYAAADHKAYLTKRYGKNWVKRDTDSPTNNSYCVFNPTLPYSQFMAQAEQNGLITKKLLKQLHRYVKSRQKYQLVQDSVAVGYEKTFYLSGDRLRLWKKYMPLKERILSLYEAGKWDEVELMLEDYLTVLKKYLKYNVVMCFDSDLLDVVKALYQEYGKTGIVNKIDRFVLPEDLEPIKVTWNTEDAG